MVGLLVRCGLTLVTCAVVMYAPSTRAQGPVQYVIDAGTAGRNGGLTIRYTMDCTGTMPQRSILIGGLLAANTPAQNAAIIEAGINSSPTNDGCTIGVPGIAAAIAAADPQRVEVRATDAGELISTFQVTDTAGTNGRISGTAGSSSKGGTVSGVAAGGSAGVAVNPSVTVTTTPGQTAERVLLALSDALNLVGFPHTVEAIAASGCLSSGGAIANSILIRFDGAGAGLDGLWFSSGDTGLNGVMEVTDPAGMGCPPSPQGACTTNQGCFVTSQAACQALAGGYAGNNTMCPSGACCVGSTCLNATPTACAGAGGVFQGGACLPSSCAGGGFPTTGACCFGEVCSIQEPEDCIAGGGAYQGNNMPCNPSICQPLAASCWACPPGGIAENETNCGIPNDILNGGCNSSPNVFSSISPGQTVCGEAQFDANLGQRDTDWYAITLDQSALVTWTVSAEFECVIGMIAGPCPVLAFIPGTVNVTTPCGTACSSACLPPGEYYLFAATSFIAPLHCNCGSGNRYAATLQVEQCSIPANDECFAAGFITTDDPVFANNINAGTSVFVSDVDCGGAPGAGGQGDTWHVYTPFESGPHTFSLCGSQFDTVLAVFDNCPGFGTLLACNDDALQACTDGINPGASRLSGLFLNAGSNYFIRVAGFNGARGCYELLVTRDPDPLGACCTGSSCVLRTEADCNSGGHSWQGPDTSCIGARTEYTSTPSLPIPDLGFVTDAIHVPDAFVVQDLNVRVTLSPPHTWVGDLTIQLRHDCDVVRLWRYHCGNTEGFDLTFDDESPFAPCASLVGSDNPTHPLSRFDGQSAFGEWTLRIDDDAGGDVGGLFQWTMSFVGQVGAPCPCEADLNGDGFVGVPDIFAFLALWFAGDLAADFDGSATIGVPDIFAYLALWFAHGTGPC